jgi:hypothetical protein
MNDDMEDNKNEDIFGDSPFSDEQKTDASEKSFKSGFSSLGKGIMHIFKGIWHIFSKKFRMNILILLLIIALILGAFYLAGFKPVKARQSENESNAVEIIFPPNVDTSLFTEEGIDDIIAGNCISQGLEKTLSDLSCPVANCPSCEEQISECPECICEPQNINVIYYQCLDGKFVEDNLLCN